MIQPGIRLMKHHARRPLPENRKRPKGNGKGERSRRSLRKRRQKPGQQGSWSPSLVSFRRRPDVINLCSPNSVVTLEVLTVMVKKPGWLEIRESFQHFHSKTHLSLNGQRSESNSLKNPSRRTSWRQNETSSGGTSNAGSGEKSSKSRSGSRRRRSKPS